MFGTGRCRIHRPIGPWPQLVDRAEINPATLVRIDIDFSGAAAVRALFHVDSLFAIAGVALSKGFFVSWVIPCSTAVWAFDFDWAATTVAYVANSSCHVLNLLIWMLSGPRPHISQRIWLVCWPA